MHPLRFPLIANFWTLINRSSQEIKLLKKKYENTRRAFPPLQLAVARAFGDIELKQPKALISCRLDVAMTDLTEHDKYLVLACAGVFDVMSDDDVIATIKAASQKSAGSKMFHQGYTVKDAAAAVVGKACERGSTDNISVAVVQLIELVPG